MVWNTKHQKEKRKAHLNMLAGSITLAILAYLVAFCMYWIPGWWREGQNKTMTIVFIAGMTGMFFAMGILYKRLKELEPRTEFAEFWAAKYKRSRERAKQSLNKRRGSK